MFFIYSHSTCAISQECVLKHDKNSYANVGTIWTYLGNIGLLQYYVIIGCDATSFFYISEKINPLKEILKKSTCSGLKQVFE